MTTALDTAKPLTIASAVSGGPLKYVDPKGSFTCYLQLGARIQWRGMKGGEWEREPKLDTPGQNGGSKGYVHKPAVHAVGPISGKTLNGLISLHNRWIEANHERDQVKGDVSRQVLLQQIKPTDEIPLDSRDRAPLTPEMQAMIESIVKAAVVAAMQSTAENQTSAKPQGGKGTKSE